MIKDRDIEIGDAFERGSPVQRFKFSSDIQYRLNVFFYQNGSVAWGDPVTNKQILVNALNRRNLIKVTRYLVVTAYYNKEGREA
ncbi:MAG: hypothetical protein D3917_16645 [Candidatus Electrothrix sp. AX5]|nr:hypothetical protein [Candidatus Electrothrix sp. AX5]